MKKIYLARIGMSDAKKQEQETAYRNQIKSSVESHIDTYIKEKIGGSSNE